MTPNQSVWYITLLIIFLCLVLAAVVYELTGYLVLVLFVAPPLVHYYLNRSSRNK